MNLFGDLNDCYGKALQQEIAESNRLEQELIEAGNRYAEMYNEEQHEIVRCKDCKHYRKNTRYPDTNLIMDYCAINVIAGKDDNWFCADGERRTDDA